MIQTPHTVRHVITLFIATLCLTFFSLQAFAADPPVTLSDDGTSFTLANGIISARIDKRSGTFSIRYQEQTVMTRGYWSQVGRAVSGDIANFGSQQSAEVRLDPTKNGGEHASVICKFVPEGNRPCLPCDVTFQYTLGRSDAGLYATALWEHKATYPRFSVGEARWVSKLNGDLFDFLAIDANRMVPMPSGKEWDQGEALALKEVRRIKTGTYAGRAEHKYDYSVIMADAPAYGWISTKKKIGVWLINPNIEYLAGGPTKLELTGHLDVNPGGLPTLLNMFHGSHYGGSSLVVAENESWTKQFGPFLIYCNSAETPDQMMKEAQDKGRAEQKAWPYAWAADANCPAADDRGTATGSIVVRDPLAPKLVASKMQVGLALPSYKSTDGGGRGGESLIDWQRDSKHYQFWTHADDAGKFTIRNIRPGTYTLYAFADGVLGEFSQANVTITAGKTTDLGQLVWIPVRNGRPLWEIGVPNRTAEEFKHGDHYWQWGLFYDYPKEFPHDVNFTIGKSDPRNDWNYVQPPHIEGNQASPTTWSINFEVPDQAQGKATLRLAFAGSRGRGGIDVAVNGKAAGNTGVMPDTGVMHRDGIRGYWFERSVPFDASLLKPGTNVLQLTNTGRNWVEGVLYDYIRLELDENAIAK